jgi:formylmethanofuran dehydrogenase subunit E
MVTIVKHEWHQVDSQYTFELGTDTLKEIYPNLKKSELNKLLSQIEAGEINIEDILDAAYDAEVDIEWDHREDNWWTATKGGYEITFELEESDNQTPLKNDDSEIKVPCFSCDAMHLENNLVQMSGQLICPTCGEGWILSHMRETEK